MTITSHIDLVRSEYEATKADHAHEDGCDNCTRGLDPANILGWDYDLDANQLLCPECAYERRRMQAQMAARAARRPRKRRIQPAKTECMYGHQMTPENTKTYVTPDNRTRYRCRECMKRRSKEYRQRQRGVL